MPHQILAFGLIACKEGGKTKKPWGKGQGSHSSVNIHIGTNGGT